MKLDPAQQFELAQIVMRPMTTEQLISMYMQTTPMLQTSDVEQLNHAWVVRGWIFTEIMDRDAEPLLATAEGVCFLHWLSECDECAPASTH